MGVQCSADHVRLSSPSGGVTGALRSVSRPPHQASRLSPLLALGLPCCPSLAQTAPWGQGLRGWVASPSSAQPS